MCINYFSCDKNISRIHIESKKELSCQIEVPQNVGKETITAKGERL